MPLERDYVVMFGPEPREFDGQQTRNVELQPCGCWAGEVWREVSAPTGTKAIDLDGKPAPVQRQWCRETRHCGVHTAAAIVIQIEAGKQLAMAGRARAIGTVVDGRVQMGALIDGNTFLAQLGDGAKQLYADADRILAEAKALDNELKALEAASGGMQRQWLALGQRLPPEGTLPFNKKAKDG